MKDLLRTLRYRLLQGWFRLVASEIKLNGKVLLLAPHPDDEVFGCGGLLSRLTKEGKDIEVIIVSDGAASHTDCCHTLPKTIASHRKQLALNAARQLELDADKLHFLDLPDGAIPADYRLELPFHPDVILVPHWGEGWPDHLTVRQIGLSLATPQTEVYEYCVWMWYYNVWKLFSQKAFCMRMTKEEHQSKLRSIATYTTSLAPCGKPWSGVLPTTFLKANSTRTEVFFKAKRSS